MTCSPLHIETAQSASEKSFTNLQPLTPGSMRVQIPGGNLLTLLFNSVHGYSLLRTQLNNDYFQSLFDESLRFDVPIEGHRKSLNYSMQSHAYTSPRHGDWARCPGDRTCIHFSAQNGRQCDFVQVYCKIYRHEVRRDSKLHG